jgi:hypothetical protein
MTTSKEKTAFKVALRVESSERANGIEDIDKKNDSIRNEEVIINHAV